MQTIHETAAEYLQLIDRTRRFHGTLRVAIGIESRDVLCDSRSTQGTGNGTMSPDQAELVFALVQKQLEANGIRCDVMHDPLYKTPRPGWGGCVLWWDPRPVQN
jgi:hypothetical protein